MIRGCSLTFFSNGIASGLENSTNCLSKAKPSPKGGLIIRFVQNLVDERLEDWLSPSEYLPAHIFRTKDLPGSARINSRISRVSNALVS